MCKHVAAVLYGVGARLDHQPELLFRLRAVDETELVTRAGAGLNVATQPPAPGRVLRTDDVAALFGLDMAGGEPGAAGDGGPATADGTERSRRKVSKTATTLMQKAKTAAADPMPRSSADARPRQETPAKAASRPAAARGGSTPGPTAPAVKNAAATRSAARRDTGTSGKAAGAAKVAASGVRSKPRHQRVGHVGGADIPSAPKPRSAADGTAKARTKGTAARKRADTKATKASGGKQRPVRWR